MHNTIAVMISSNKNGQSSLKIDGIDTELQSNMQDDMASMGRGLHRDIATTLLYEYDNQRKKMMMNVSLTK